VGSFFRVARQRRNAAFSVLDGENRCEAALIQVSFAKNMKRVLAGMSAPNRRIPPSGIGFFRNTLTAHARQVLSKGRKAFVFFALCPYWVRFFEWASSDAERWVFTLAGFVLQFPAGRAKRALP